MVSDNNKEDFYSRLEDQLVLSQNWPGIYLFKFIVKSSSDHVETIKTYFKKNDPIFKIKNSSKNNFVSLSVNVVMESPKSVILMYQKIGLLEGVIAL